MLAPYKRWENGRNDLLPLPYGGYPVRRSLQVVDERGGTHLPGPTEAKGSVPRLWCGPVVGFSGGPLIETEQR